MARATKLLMAPLRRAALAVALAMGLWSGSACTSPTLPLPPPASPSIMAGSEAGKVKLSSVQGAEPNAVILILNRDPGLARDKRVSGTIADGAGTWEVEVVAKTGDVLDVSQDNGNVRSPSTTVTVP